MKQGFANMLENLGEKALSKVLQKVPEWKDTPGLEVPGTLCAEQCSSSKTASFKTSVARRLAPEARRLADLTGGLGVDSWFFSREFGEVLYFERSETLAGAAARNFSRLGATGVRTLNLEFGADGEALSELRGFAPDLIYLDPARRSADGRKVFLLEDCEPDLLSLLPTLLGISGKILVKVSPMADISMLRARLGDVLRETAIVQADGEVKELLLSICSDGGQYRTVLCNLDTGASCEFLPGEDKDATMRVAKRLPKSGELVFEPGPGLSKAGAYRTICEKFSADALGLESHLYIVGEECATDAARFGKVWKVLESVPMCGRSVKETGRKYPEADVTARGLKMSSEELASRLGSKPGRGVHIFGVGCGAACEKGKALIAATRL